MYSFCGKLLLLVLHRIKTAAIRKNAKFWYVDFVKNWFVILTSRLIIMRSSAMKLHVLSTFKISINDKWTAIFYSAYRLLHKLA